MSAPLAWVLVTGIVIFTLFWLLYVRTYLLRRYYEKQGIPFITNCYAVIGAELQVTELQKKNKSHDWLYIDQPVGLVGTIRGFSVQLYATSAETAEKVIQQTGKRVERDTPALFSFGQLSPLAITFATTLEPSFMCRKATMTRALNDMKRLSDLASRRAADILDHFNLRVDANLVIDARELLDIWTREVNGAFIWGEANVNRCVNVLDINGVATCLPLMTALSQTFADLRTHSNTFWNRVYFPLASWPVTREARRIAHNVTVLRQEMDRMMSSPEKGTVAEILQRENDAAGIPVAKTRDDLATATIAGLHTVKSAAMAALWHILQDGNVTWKAAIMKEIEIAQADPENQQALLAHSESLNAMMHESLRYEPPGSLINNVVTQDFDLSLRNNIYKIKAGTRLVTCIHALHQNEDSWRTRQQQKSTPLDRFDPSRFIEDKDLVGSKCFMPFGKGPRRCPGQNIGILMIKCFIATLLSRYPHCRLVLPEGQPRDLVCFNISSRATYNIFCTSAEMDAV